jgi:ADP-ribose pyrophosphatase YjhB (NUDIX family)
MIALERWAMRCAHDVRRTYWFLLRPDTTSVKCLVTRTGSVLLVRHTYGDRSMWRLPGGGIKRGEQPAAAIQRELNEEVGVGAAVLHPIATLYEKKHASTTYHCFEAQLDRTLMTINPREIAEARWFRYDRLPAHREWLVSALLGRANAV